MVNKVHNNNKRGGEKPKMTKEDRRAKYTQIARDRRDKKFQRDRFRHTVCFKCREKGHTSNQCGETVIAAVTNEICYKCGSPDHSLKECKLYRKGDKKLPHATCYICSNKGHLASACPSNVKGIYVNGGSCRTCGSTQHVSLSCPELEKNKRKQESGDDDEKCLPNESYDDLLSMDEATPKSPPVAASATATTSTKKKKKVIKF